MTTETHIEGPANNTKEPTPPSRRGRWAFPCSLRMLGPARRWAVNATGQRTALRRCDLGAELPLVAVTSHRATNTISCFVPAGETVTTPLSRHTAVPEGWLSTQKEAR